jgi:rubrerythrin
MEYLKIRNWAKWQSYRADRGQPPWIKIHRRVMRNPEWVSLTDAERGQLVAIWLLAADHDGVIPASPEVIQKLCYLTKPPDLNKFTDLGFIENGWRHVGVTLASNGSQRDSPEAKAETEKNRIEESRNMPAYGQFKNVKLTDDEFTKLKGQFGIEDAKRRIEALSEYLSSKGKKYKSHYATILTWARKDGPGIEEKETKYWTCRNCGKKASSLMDGLCRKCKEPNESNPL